MWLSFQIEIPFMDMFKALINNPKKCGSDSN